jgi:hypothetical protein
MRIARDLSEGWSKFKLAISIGAFGDDQGVKVVGEESPSQSIRIVMAAG